MKFLLCLVARLSDAPHALMQCCSTLTDLKSCTLFMSMCLSILLLSICLSRNTSFPASNYRSFFMPPTSEKLRGHIGLGLSVRPSVRVSVRLSVILGSWETREPLMLESWNFICGMYMKNKRTRIFFFLHQSCGSGVMPLFRLCMKNLVNRISGEPLKLESWYLAYSYRPRCRWTD